MKNITLDEELLSKIKGILSANEYDKSNLLAILLEVQAIMPRQYVSKEVAKVLAKYLDISLSKIYDVITFYSALSDSPRGNYIIQICNSTACMVNKYETLKDVLEQQLEIKVGQTTEDGMFSLMYTPCFGACDVSPAFRIGENVFGNLTKKKIKEIIYDYRIQNHD